MQVCIWTAWSAPVEITTKIFRAMDLKNEKASAIGKGISRSLQLGKNLHISLTIARPVSISGQLGTFPAGELLAYDIEIAFSNNNSTSRTERSLRDLGLLEGKDSIVYGEFHLPTFFIQKKTGPALNVMHGSCRKLHGGGQDCLAVVDAVVGSHLNDLGKRPSALFLTGDQIYADDVAGPLSHHLTSLGITLSGFEEQIKGIGRRLTEIGIGERQKLVKEYARFTSEEAGNHLLSFSEFAAMYLIAWNVDLWPDKFSPFTNLLGHKESDKNEKRLKRKYDSEVQQLENTRKEMRAIRRVLANIPTYMICDDHDITDDWNITDEWVNNVRNSACGSQVIANGLTAYWAFQAWGNDPESFNDSFINTIIEFLQQKTKPDGEVELLQDRLLNFHGWTFSCQTTPITVFLDCRTQRKYDTLNGPPELVNDLELRTMFKVAEKAGYVKGDPIVIVVPTPVFGFDWIERIQRIMARVYDVYKADLEVWSANKDGLAQFLTFVSENFDPSFCVLFSGDVHYGFTKTGTFSLQSGNLITVMNVVQLTSSALKTTSLRKRVVVGAIIGHIREFFSPKTSIRSGKLSHQEMGGQFEYAAHDWIATSSIVRMGQSGILSLLIADNNIGQVAINMNQGTVLHNLLVRNGQLETKQYESKVSIIERDHSRQIPPASLA